MLDTLIQQLKNVVNQLSHIMASEAAEPEETLAPACVISCHDSCKALLGESADAHLRMNDADLSQFHSFVEENRKKPASPRILTVPSSPASPKIPASPASPAVLASPKSRTLSFDFNM